MSWFSSFFKKDTVKVLVSLATQFLKTVLGHVGSTLFQIAQEEVSRVQFVTGKSGPEKAQMAFKAIRDRLKNQDVKDSEINFAIETAVQILKQTQS